MGIGQGAWGMESGKSRIYLSLGRIPIDPHMDEGADAGQTYLEQYPESEVAESCNLIIDKIVGINQEKLFQNQSIYYDL